MPEIVENKMQFRREVFIALVITGLACCAAFSNLLLATNNLYPGATDFMGHMCKVKFLADSISHGQFPAWFPYWYNGTAVAQYYSPLAYWIMAPVYLLTKNPMLTFKVFSFAMLFIGGFGTWFFCRKKIGRWCGLFSIPVFCLQPYVLLTIFREGQVAQEPIIAMAPWYLLVLISFSQDPGRKKFIAASLLCTAMILSHASSAFMLCACLSAVLFLLVLFRKIRVQSFVLALSTIVLSGILTAFWSVVGVTGLENPGTPEVLVDRALYACAKLDWFLNTNPNSFFTFAIPATAGSLLGTIVYVYNRSKKKEERKQSDTILFIILFTAVTILFSFGSTFFLFDLIPMAKTLFAGRILNATAASSAILCAYLLCGLWRLAATKRKSVKAFTFLVCTALIGATLFFMNPYQQTYLVNSDSDFKEMIASIDAEGDNFAKGRYDYQFYFGYQAREDYFAIMHDFNASQGVNIEGTPHNNTLWNQNLALSVGDSDYVAKNHAFWNVRYFLVQDIFEDDFKSLLEKNAFQKKAERNGNLFFVSEKPSSYFLTDQRNGLLLGPGAPMMALEFPYLVYEQREKLSDYTLEELSKYKLIYLCEPVVDTLQEKEDIEKKVTSLTNQGTTVIIEPVTTKGFPLFGVTTSEVMTERLPVIIRQNASLFDSAVDNIKMKEEIIYSKVLFGLDRTYYKLVQNEGSLENGAIGVKKAGEGEVVFIGMHLSQYLKAVYASIWGIQEEGSYPASSGDVKKLYEDIFKTYGVSTDFWPEAFPVEKAAWNEDGVAFSYTSVSPQDITVSVTYTPRWQATLDGKPLTVGQKENLTTLSLPAGKHEVRLEYGLTVYGKIGYAISLAGMITFFLIVRFYDIIIRIGSRLFTKIVNYLQL